MKFPGKSERLAEFIGIMMGDGYNTYGETSVAGNSETDRAYLLNYVSPMIEELFGIRPKTIFRKDQKTMYLKVTCIAFCKFLGTLGLPIGPKKQLEIPKWILKNEKFMKSFLRGLVDTDGSLAIKRKYRRDPYYPVINIHTKHGGFAKQIAEWLEKQNFRLWCGPEVHKGRAGYRTTIVHRVQLSGDKALGLWIDNIGFSNPHNIEKVERLKNGANGI